MITTQEIETALKNAGWKYRTRKVNFVDMGIKYFKRFKCPNNVYSIAFRIDLKVNMILDMIFHQICINECYFFKKQHVEYGTIDYEINELIEDLRSWL
jgi:hypothetical protein